MLIVFRGDNPEETGSIYRHHYEGENFFYADKKLSEIISATQTDKSVVVKIKKFDNSEEEFKFDL